MPYSGAPALVGGGCLPLQRAGLETTDTLETTHARIPAEIRALTGLRGVCALDVVLGHYDVHNDPGLHTFIFHDGAVDVFFALSTFTLCLVYGAGLGTRLNLRAYAVARFARVYPLFFATTLFACLLHFRHGFGAAAAGQTDWMIAGRLVAQFALLAALPIRAIAGSINVQAWSVSVEAICYVTVFPLLFALSPRPRSARVRLVLAAAGGAVAFMAYRWHYAPAANGFGDRPVADRWAYWVPLTRGVAMSVAGWAAYLAWRFQAGFRTAIGEATDALALVFLLIVVGERFGLIGKQALVMVAPFLIAGLMDARSVTARLLGSRPVHALGVISYSVYLLHLEVYDVVTHALPWLLQHEVWRIVVPTGATLVAATLSYTLFETPMRRWLRGGMRPVGAAGLGRVQPAGLG